MEIRFTKQNTAFRSCAAAAPSVEILPVLNTVMILAVSLCVTVLRISMQIV